MPTQVGKRLLIADDDSNLLAAYVFFFTTHGYEIRTAIDGTSALSEYHAWLPDIVILDIQMPGMDGRAVVRAIRNTQTNTIPLMIAITGLNSPAERAESINSGFHHHFVKPADLSAVLGEIGAHIGRGVSLTK